MRHEAELLTKLKTLEKVVTQFAEKIEQQERDLEAKENVIGAQNALLFSIVMSQPNNELRVPEVAYKGLVAGSELERSYDEETHVAIFRVRAPPVKTDS